MRHVLDERAVGDTERERADRRAAREAARARETAPPRAERRTWRPHAALLESRSGQVLAAAVALLALLTVVGLAALWPPGDKPHGASQALGGPTVGATVLAQKSVRCPGPAGQRCRALVARVDDGPRTQLDLGPQQFTSSFAAGDRIRVRHVAVPAGSRGVSPYEFADADRHDTLLWLAVVFAVLVVILARRRGLLALAGFALSLLLIVDFVVPAILAGSPALLVALVGSLAVMFVTVGFTYGISAQSAAAVLGIAGSLLLAAVLGTTAVSSARLDGRAGELSAVLSQSDSQLSLQGVVLAGLVLGALGVLADMAVTQASTVMALRRANPGLSPRRLFGEAFAVGRDHLVATTHTLVLAYVGATLPLLLVLHAVHVSGSDALNSQDVAEPIVATLVGVIALLISVPLTTGFAALLIGRIPAEALPETHVHAH